MRLALTLLVGFVATTASAQSRVIHVRNFGEDSASCGEQLTPCRSIGQGLELAKEGDTVLVGPGIYGDLDRNGIIGESGEERHGSCFVCIPYRVTLLSERGAAHTTIDARNLPVTAVAVGWQQQPAALGYADQGFTVLAGEGPAIELARSSTVWGNRIVGGTVGIRSVWQGAEVHENEVTNATGPGIELGGGLFTGPSAVTGNVIARNGGGVLMLNGTLANNTIADNRDYGAVMTNALRRISVVRNLFIRNAGAGLALSRGPSAEEPHDDIVIDSNDFIGNDPEEGCGLLSFVEGEPILAANNFWAPASDFGVTRQVACDRGSAATIVDPPRLQPH